MKGMGKAKAAQIKAAIEIGYRLSREENTPAVFLSKPAEVYQLMAHRLAEQLQEELWVLALNTRNRLVNMGTTLVYRDIESFFRKAG